MTLEQADATAAGAPVLRVVKGNPSAHELAALVAVVSARAAAPPASEPSPPSRWAARSIALRRPLPHGPGAWRASALPGAY